MNAPCPYTSPAWASSALITIDTQVDTLEGGTMTIPGTDQVLPNMARLLKAYRAAGRPIVHIVRLYRPDGGNVDLCRKTLVESGGRLMIPGTEGSQLAPALRPASGFTLDSDLLLAGGVQKAGPGEDVIYKSRWGAFYKTPLEDRLCELKVDTLVFSGCNYPNCPRTSIYEASERDFRLVLVADALSGLYPKGEEEMSNIGVQLMTTDQVLAEIQALS